MTTQPEVAERYGRWWVFLPSTVGDWRVWVPVESEEQGYEVVAQWAEFRASWDGVETS